MCSTKYLDVINTMAASVYRQIPHILSFIEILRNENKIYIYFFNWHLCTAFLLTSPLFCRPIWMKLWCMCHEIKQISICRFYETVLNDSTPYMDFGYKYAKTQMTGQSHDIIWLCGARKKWCTVAWLQSLRQFTYRSIVLIHIMTLLAKISCPSRPCVTTSNIIHPNKTLILYNIK